MAFSCLSEDDSQRFSTTELFRLLTSDSAKSWVLTERVINGESVIMDCEKDDELAFVLPTVAGDTATMHRTTGIILCPGQADSLLYQGYWEVLDSLNASYLRWVINNDTSFWELQTVTSQLLSISSTSGLDVITEHLIAN